jgi:uroporphyrinogen III methyltransferase/synthase
VVHGRRPADHRAVPARAKVDGRRRDVLVLVFERQALADMPANPPGVQVEMGRAARRRRALRPPRMRDQGVAIAVDRGGGVSEMAGPGIVYLVGAGPGDPGLITVAGRDCIRRAEVLVYDRLVGAALLAEAPLACERIDVGKQAGRHALPQAEINALLVARCRAGQVVTRLKGGDPFVFGRGGEEAEALAAAGLPFAVVPGVTSAIAAPAYAGIPVTHRALASAVHILTGHEDPTKPESRLAWEHIAPGDDTLVVLMGMEHLAGITAQLIAHGRPAGTPAALIERGTTPRQRTLTGTLADIAARAAAAGLAAPAVLVVGAVVGLRARLAWFDRRPLFGKRVLVTRAQAQASALSERLAALGAEPIELPTIRILPPADEGPLDAALARLGEYDWVIFTSANGVAHAFARLAAQGRDARAFAGCRLAAIGPATAAALAERGLRADRVAAEAVAEGLLATLAGEELAGRRVLLPQAEQAREALAAGLTARGAVVEVVAAYRTVPEAADPAALALVRAGQIDVVTLTSASAARHLAAALGGELGGLERALVAAIGPVTAAAAAELGLRVGVVAAEHTIPGLVAAIVAAVGPAGAGAGAAHPAPEADAARGARTAGRDGGAIL